MRANVVPGTLIAAAIACLHWVYAPEVRAQQEVGDTVVATEADSRPTHETRDAEPDGSAAKLRRSEARATRKDRYAIPDPALELTDPRTYRFKITIRI